MLLSPSDQGDALATVLSPGVVLHVTGLHTQSQTQTYPSCDWLQVALPVDEGGSSDSERKKGLVTAWLKREVRPSLSQGLRK